MESFINLDKNMVVSKTIGDVEAAWYDVRRAPFKLYGLYQPETEPFFHRLPMDVAMETSEAVYRLSQESAGGRVRFSTDSSFIAIRAKFRVVGRSPHLTLISSAGFDLYMDGEFGTQFVQEFRMPYDMTDSYEQIIRLGGEGMRAYTIHFPVHSVVETLEIGLEPGAAIGGPRPYRDIKPIGVYGSSIVHGTAATRPGYIYPNVLARMLNADVMDIGFSGHAKGEPALGRYMAQLPMSVFVCDYDHNAPTVEHLQATHYPLYEIIREKNPDLPYIMVSRPNFWTCHTEHKVILKRRDVIMRSYLKARELGDENVYFIDGLSFFSGHDQYENTVDHVHPNDAGFQRMAEVIGAVIRHALEP